MPANYKALIVLLKDGTSTYERNVELDAILEIPYKHFLHKLL